MKTPLRFLKKTALAAIFASSAATVSMADTQPCVSWFRENLSSPTAARWNPGTGDESVFDNTNSRLTVDGSITYQPEQVSTEGNVVVTEATLEFSAPGASLPDVPSGAQAALTVAAANNVTNYYVLGKENNQPAWIAVERSTVAPTDQAVPVKITIDYDANNGAGSVTYAIGETPVTAYTGALANAPASGSRYVSALDFQGNGVVSGILSGTDGILASHKIGSEYYASYVDALEAALADGNNAAVTAWDTSDWAATSCDGTAANPYEIRDLATLKAFQAAVANSNGLDYAYVQTADIGLDAPWPGIGLQNGKDDYKTAKFDDAAFKGTYDGGNHSITNFQMAGGNLDYCGFFNSVSNAVIKNLKIQYKEGTFAADTTSSTTESGATFVGVAKGATLQNLTSLPKDASTGVSCGKGFGGIVGYLTCGSTVDSCTNYVDLTSLQPNKCGGIAMIAQGDAGVTATIRNCQNNGTTTGTAEHGGLVGYVQLNLTIDGCESTVQDQLLNHYSGTITVQGVNKANANSVSYVKHSGQSPADFDGLHFATVADDTATFVYDADLAAGNQYKVMGPGATATYQFTAPGTIAFDTALSTPTYAITAAAGLDVTPSTSGTVTTYTAAALKYPAVFLK